VTQIDVNGWIGEYPWHGRPRWTARELIEELAYSSTTELWLSHLGSAFGRDCAAGNIELYSAADADARLRPVPTIDPTLSDWRDALDVAAGQKTPAVRYDPALRGLDPASDAVCSLLAACAERGMPLMMAVRLEDLRQRDPDDAAADLPASAVRRLVRSNPDAKLIITHADRETIEQVHFGSTPAEARRLLWDISWIWGPPEDHLQLLFRTVGIDRFAFGTAVPLRLAENSIAKLDLLELDVESRQRVCAGNVATFLNSKSNHPSSRHSAGATPRS
jgi:hypothetical protein